MLTLTAIDDLAKTGRVDEAIAACSDLLASDGVSVQFAADLLRKKAELLDWYKSQYHECEALLREELKLRITHDVPGIAHTYFQLGLILDFMFRQSEAIEALELGLRESTDPLLSAKIENLMGDIYVPIDCTRARAFLESSARRLATLDDQYMQRHVALSLAWLAAQEGSPSAALLACDRELQLARERQSAGLQGTAHLRMAQIFALAGDRDGALTHSSEAARIGRDNMWQCLVDSALQVAVPG